MAKTTARKLARYIVDECTRRNRPLTNVELQRVLFVLQVTYSSKYHRLLFGDEFVIRSIGPVIPEVYAAYSAYGNLPIEETYSDADDLGIKRGSSTWRFIDDGISFCLNDKDALVTKTVKYFMRRARRQPGLIRTPHARLPNADLQTMVSDIKVQKIGRR